MVFIKNFQFIDSNSLYEFNRNNILMPPITGPKLIRFGCFLKANPMTAGAQSIFILVANRTRNGFDSNRTVPLGNIHF
ncbi:hypothetical protein DERP_001482 [Dermatophagoides pteronyssinus]|uniref:Uncharacterized protein n=1 Tax=Dermatophagoides pteronyssinus TaxID=6956 RepID=A0ABQ8JEK3_DERPT|nr:hypothetical protein DERP_001482 [Dermatophagoides pteronyssinus]